MNKYVIVDTKLDKTWILSGEGKPEDVLRTVDTNRNDRDHDRNRTREYAVYEMTQNNRYRVSTTIRKTK